MVRNKYIIKSLWLSVWITVEHSINHDLSQSARNNGTFLKELKWEEKKQTKKSSHKGWQLFCRILMLILCWCCFNVNWEPRAFPYSHNEYSFICSTYSSLTITKLITSNLSSHQFLTLQVCAVEFKFGPPKYFHSWFKYVNKMPVKYD